MKIFKHPFINALLTINLILAVFSLQLSETHRREIKNIKLRVRQNSTSNDSQKGNNTNSNSSSNSTPSNVTVTTFGIPDPLLVTVKIDDVKSLIGEIRISDIKTTSGKYANALYLNGAQCANSESESKNIFSRENDSRYLSFCQISNFHCIAPADVSKPRSICGTYKNGLELHNILLEENEMNLVPGKSRLSASGCYDIAEQLNKKTKDCNSKCLPLKPDLTRFGSQIVHYNHIIENTTLIKEEIARIDLEIESEIREAKESRERILAGETAISEYELSLANLQIRIQDIEVQKAAQMEMLSVYEQRLSENTSREQRISALQKTLEENEQEWQEVQRDLLFHCVKDDTAVNTASQAFIDNNREQFGNQISKLRSICLLSQPRLVRSKRKL